MNFPLILLQVLSAGFIRLIPMETGRQLSSLYRASEFRVPELENAYSVVVGNELDQSRKARIGLCADCRFMRQMESDRGSTFFFCQRSASDARFPKYPRLPVLQCAGYEPLSADDRHRRASTTPR